MAERFRPAGESGFLPWCVGAFHAAAFVTVAVALLHLLAPLGDLLAGLDTAVGFGLYLALWALAWWSARRALAEVDLRSPGGGLRRALGAGVRWGGATGTAFFLVLSLVVVVGGLVAADGGSVSPTFAAIVLGAGVVGAVLAFLVGAAVGAALATLDAGLAGLAGRVVDERVAGAERAKSSTEGN